MKSLDALRASTGFLDDLASSTAMQPYAHLLRDLADPRPATEKIHESIARCAVTPSRLHTARQRVGVVLNKLATSLPSLPLRGIPDRETVRRHLERLDKEKSESGGTFPHRPGISTYASTLASTT